MGKFADDMAPKFADSTEPKLGDFKEGSVAWMIQRYVEDMALPGMKALGASHLYTLRRLQRSKIAAKRAGQLKKSDFIDFCKERRQTVCPATVMQDVNYIGGALKYAAAAWDECEEDATHALNALAAARPMLVKLNLIGKSTPRTRVPTDDEIERLLAYFTEQSQKKRTKIHMVPMILFALASTRRISEICRIEHGDIDWEKREYVVRDLKHPTKKKGNDKVFPLLDPMPEIIRMQPRLTNDPHERVFPYREKSAGQAYTVAKKRLGIENLHFHDNRREAITRWLRKLPPHKVRLISGHETTIILERVYDASDAQDVHAELAKQQQEQRPSA